MIFDSGQSVVDRGGSMGGTCAGRGYPVDGKGVGGSEEDEGRD